MSRIDPVQIYPPGSREMANVQVDNEKIRLLGPSNDKSKVENGKLFLCTAVALIAAFVMGYSIGYSSPAIPNMMSDESHKIIANSDEESWFGSLLTIGAIFGGPLAGFFLDRSGRKLTIMLCAVPFVTGWVAIATANGVAGLYIGRILTGIGAGMASLATPVYIAEMASPELRGLLGSSFQLVVTLGVLSAYALGIPLDYKYLALFAAGCTALFIIGMTFMPETARYLLMKHEREKALRILTWLRGDKVDVDSECREIEDGLDSQEPFSMSEFLNPSLYKPLIISVMLMFFQQWSGINAVMFYTVEIFQSTGLPISPNIATVIIGAVQVVATLLSVLLMDRAGRRVLLLLAGTGMAISSTTFGLYYELQPNNAPNNASMYLDFNDIATTAAPSSDYSWLSITSLIIYTISFSLGWGAIPWLLMSEIFPSKAKGPASSIATLFNWSFAFAVTKSFQALKEPHVLDKDGVFWLFAGVCAVGVIFVALCVPETKGLTLEEIEAKFDGRNRDANPEV